MMYRFLTIAQHQQLWQNGSPENREKDHVPVVKLFYPGTGCTWLLTEIDPDEPRLAFGLCDLGMGFPELGYVDLNEMDSVKIKGIWSVERDLDFKGKYPISVYASAARVCDAITEDDTVLIQHVPKKWPGYKL
ncbi:DUF2958 domain-containing protein [Chitinophaga pendula]|uniref:DUF2958 domain-containing protein n=1 Tax=Chitinophaga TaxID=79328 RepID=UPI0012FE16A2|nr:MULTISPECIES: DUF2958 domain-containing protein [Chitinophaga]UCJ09110.1 DUF2958 domain-containing protein [Chitinophaga pendula]